MSYLTELEELPEVERFAALKAAKSSIINEKKSGIKETTAVSFVPSVRPRTTQGKTSSSKATAEDTDEGEPVEPGELEVTVVCNTAWFCDDQLDVIIDTAYDASIKAKGSSIPHIRDHQRSCTSHVADVKKVYTKKISLKDLGYDAAGTTTALLMDSTIIEDYDEKVFEFYKNGKINQHSIGLRYGKLSLAINSKHEDDKEYLVVWDKYYPSIINKDYVDSRGYFWAVEEIDIIENSCVLFGSNPLTPTLSIKSSGEGVPSSEATKTTEEVLPSVSLTPKGVTMSKTAAETLVELQAELETLKASQSLEIAKSIKVEKNRILEIIKAGNTFGIKSTTVMSAIEKGYPLDVVKDMFTEIAEHTDSANGVNTGEGSTASNDSSTIAAAKASKKAEAKAGSFDSIIEAGLSAEDYTTTKLFAGVN